MYSTRSKVDMTLILRPKEKSYFLKVMKAGVWNQININDIIEDNENN